MNTFNRFIIATLLVLFTSQAFAVKPQITDVKRINPKTVLVTFDQSVKMHSTNLDPNRGVAVNLYSKAAPGSGDADTYYLGDPQANTVFFPIALQNPVDGYSRQIKILFGEDSFKLADESNKASVMLFIGAISFENKKQEQGDQSYRSIVTLSVSYDFAVLSASTFSVDEGVSFTYILYGNDGGASFDLVEGDSSVFQFSGNNNEILDFNGTNTNYESDKKTYIAKIKVSLPAHPGAYYTIVVTINNIFESNIAIVKDQSFGLSTNAPIGTLVGTVAVTGDSANAFNITNNNGLFAITNSGRITNVAILTTPASYALNIEVTGNDSPAVATASVTININPNSEPASINNIDISVDENMNTTVLVISANDTTVPAQTLTYSISGDDQDKFDLVDNTLTFKNPPDYEEKTTYSLTLEVYDTISITYKPIVITILNIKEKTLAIDDSILSVNKNAPVNTVIGNVNATGEIATYAITSGNNDSFFKINNQGSIQLAKSLAQETALSYSIVVKITGNDADDKTAQITINTIIQPTVNLTNRNITLGAAIGEVIGILSTANANSTDLTYSIENNDYFEIIDNKLKIKKVTTTPGTHQITITASNNTQAIATQNFTITIIPTLIISQFTITQDENKGRLIKKSGGNVTVRATASAGTYHWDSELTNNSNNDNIFVFNPNSLDIGTQTIKLKVTIGNAFVERVLQLKLVENYPANWSDTNGNGVSDNKESGDTLNQQLPAGANKKITSLTTGTRLLLGIMGENSGHLTFAQMEQYTRDNHLTTIAKDTSTTGDIYDYVVEGLSVAGASTEVIIELSTAIPAEAELRKYSLTTNSWSNFVTNDNNLFVSKTSATCTDDSPWQTGLIKDATCLKLTIKDGGENDTDGNQANGVIESTISIATPLSITTPVIDNNNSSNGGGGCVYNPNAAARFDIGFVLLMILSAYYFIRRKRCFIH